MSKTRKRRGLISRVLGRMFAATFRDPPDWLVGAMGGGASRSGVHVNPTTSLTLSAYFACIRAISEDVAKVPLPVYEKLKAHGKKRLPDHPLHRLLNVQPSRDMTALTWRETMTQHALGWGNGYSEIIRNGSGKLESLHLITPDRVTPAVRDGRVVYDVTGPGEVRTVPASRMFHLHGLGGDGLTGYSIARLAREAIGLALAQERSGALFFGNSANPSGVLETDGVLDEPAQQRLKDSFRETYEGLDNRHRTLVLEQGLKWHPVAVPFSDAQWIEGRGFSAEDIARFFRVPPPIIGLMEKATHRNVQELFNIYVTLTLTTWFERWEQEISRKLLVSPSDSELFAEHNAEGLLRGDIESRYKAHSLGRLGGWLSVNDIRAMENMNPIGPQGDIYLEPLNMQPAGSEPEKPTTDSDEPDDDADADDLAAIREARIGSNGEAQWMVDNITESMTKED